MKSRPQRIHARHVEQIRESMSERDWQILTSVHRLRRATGAHLERLHFADLAPASRERTRRRVLARLVAWRVLATLERRIGGVRAGSSGSVYGVDTAGYHLLRLHQADAGQATPRRPRPPTTAFLHHALAVTELYVQLVDHARTGRFTVAKFATEPDCWWPATSLHGGLLKPDAYTVLSAETHADAWWIEVDLATESVPRLASKLKSYMEFARRGGSGPDEVMPRVLVTTPTAQRHQAVTTLINRLKPPADQLITVADHSQASDYLSATLFDH